MNELQERAGICKTRLEGFDQHSTTAGMKMNKNAGIIMVSEDHKCDPIDTKYCDSFCFGEGCLNKNMCHEYIELKKEGK